MELNAEQIKKALECISRTSDVLCKGCDYRKYDGLACHRIGAKNALALINKLTEENEKLKKPRHILMPDGIGGVKIETIPSADQIRADTVRKMHSMLCEGRVSNDNVVIVANQIAKEMLEGENED